MTPDFITNVAPALEEGWRGLFAAQDIFAVTRQNAPDSFQTATPRVEIRCKLGAATGRRHVEAPGILHFDAWFFDMAVRCVTRPQNTEADNLLYDNFVSRIRAQAQTFGQATWVDQVNFPNHLIVEPLKDTTTDDNLQSDDNEEFAILNFSGIVQVRTSAWNN